MFEQLRKIYVRPEPFEFYTAPELWTDEHTSERMLATHLDGTVDAASRSPAFIDRSVAWLASRFGVGRGTRIADFGCGPGLYTTRLAELGADVTGIDFSRRSLRYAQDTAASKDLAIRYLNQNYLECALDERFDLLLMIMCDFCALNPSQRKQMLDKFRSLLQPDGHVVLDVYSLAAFAQRCETATCERNLLDGFWSADEYYGFLNTFRYDRQQVALDKYTIVEAAQTRTIYNWLQHFSPDSLERELRACGLGVEELFADVSGSPHDPAGTEFAAVVRKAD